MQANPSSQSTLQVVPAVAARGDTVTLTASPGIEGNFVYSWSIDRGSLQLLELPNEQDGPVVHWNTADVQPGVYTVTVRIAGQDFNNTMVDVPLSERVTVGASTIVSVNGPNGTEGFAAAVSLQRSSAGETPDLPLWIIIQNATEAISFQSYDRYMDILMQVAGGIGQREERGWTSEPRTIRQRMREVGVRNPDQLSNIDLEYLLVSRTLSFNDADTYRLLKLATEAFLITNCGFALSSYTFTQGDAALLRNRTQISTNPGSLQETWNGYLESVNGSDDPVLPYLALVRAKLGGGFVSQVPSYTNAPFVESILGHISGKLRFPCMLELIWSYWQEEGMLVQTMNAISRRFQNIRGPGADDPLANMEIDPLRPLNNFLWGYIQDEQHRLSVVRRAYEYSHEYGLSLYGKAVPPLRPADSRSKFLEAFHNLLYLTTVFFQQDDDTTVIADGFPVFNALKEVDLLLSQGAHNQFGDLPSTARQEMLLQQWLLARPEFQQFLPTRTMVAYPERWMDRVDAMKTLQGWTDVPVLHFRDLAVFGEKLLLSIRFGSWLNAVNANQAANWARFWRGAIQNYIHAYRAVTGVDLRADVTDNQQATERYMQPSIHLQRRLSEQQRNVLSSGTRRSFPAAQPGAARRNGQTSSARARLPRPDKEL